MATDIGSSTTVEQACERMVRAAPSAFDSTLCSILVCENGVLVPKASSEDAPEDGARFEIRTE